MATGPVSVPAGETPIGGGRSFIIVNSPDLAESPHLVPLANLLDKCFQHSHLHGCPGKELLDASVKRFQSGPQQLARELGPYGFCIIMFEETSTDTGKEKKIIASGSAKPFKKTLAGENHGSDLIMLFKRQPDSSTDPPPTAAPDMDIGENEVGWELLAFATDLHLQGQGIGRQLDDLAVAEIRKRVITEWERSLAGDKGYGKQTAPKPKIVLMLSTLQEVNEAYYQRRGWRTTSARRFEPGTNRSRDGFTIAEMRKVLDWHDDGDNRR